MAKEDKEVDTKQNCDKCKIVYELTDGKYEEKIVIMVMMVASALMECVVAQNSI